VRNGIAWSPGPGGSPSDGSWAGTMIVMEGSRSLAGAVPIGNADVVPDEGGPEIGSFFAIGDSFTEGLHDPYPDGPPGSYRGWADRFAELLAERASGFRYANLAVRGKLLREVVAEQLPQAIDSAPDLVSIAAGGNDMLRPGSDPDVLAELFDRAVARLRSAGCTVLLFTGFDLRQFPVLRLLRGKVAIYNQHLRAIADNRGCLVADLWPMQPLHDPRAWGTDRLHLTPDGHRRVALRVCEAVGVPAADDWRSPWPSAAPVGWLTGRRQDLSWARRYAAPWAGRRLRGASSGDAVSPKRPDLAPLSPRAAGPGPALTPDG
jgi:lysophospholipase L1-like esterase